MKITETFYTIQGEAKHLGIPSVFIRTGVCHLRCAFCFSENTKILMAPFGKNKKIKDIKIGEEVLSYDYNLNKFCIKKVINTYKREIDKILKIKFNNDFLLITEEHPLYVIGKGWVKAKELKIGDILFDIDNKKRLKYFNMMNNKEISEKVSNTQKNMNITRPLEYLWSDNNFRKNNIERMINYNPMKKPEIAIKTWINRKHKLSNVEKRICNIIRDNNLPVIFVGDGSLIINNKNPDFKILGQDKVIEVWDSRLGEYIKRGDDYINSRTNHFLEFGFKTLCLGIDYYDDDNDILKKIQEFIFNGKEIKNIEIINKDNNYKAFNRLKKNNNLIDVYNLEIEDTHTYFANGVLSHNCDSKFTWNPNSYKELKDEDDVKAFFENVIKPHPTNEVVITGGEPLIEENHDRLRELCDILKKNSYWITFETTFLTKPEDIVNSDIVKNIERISNKLNLNDCYPALTYSVSPKINLEAYENKYTLDQVLKFYLNFDLGEVFSKETIYVPGLYYKFVYNKDIEEILLNNMNFMKCFKESIYIMPETMIPIDSKENKQNMIDCWEFCKKYNFRYSPRIHVDVFGLKRGV